MICGDWERWWSEDDGVEERGVKGRRSDAEYGMGSMENPG